MHPRLVQAPREPWPSGYGDVVGVLDVSLESLAERHSLYLFAGDDNLGNYRAAAIRLDSGRVVGLLFHEGGPEGETEIYADAEDEPAEVIGELLGSLALPPTTCSWLRGGSQRAEIAEH